jgi:ADP-ribose pyrophosphatase YjhB (NUDIX family)
MKIFVCENGCCSIQIEPYNENKSFTNKKRNKHKAGIFIYDPKEDKILLVQSRGNLWGPPKGTIQVPETEKQCAIREVKEETGLIISLDNNDHYTRIDNKSTYYYINKDVCVVEIQRHIPDNDANGIGWVKPECLKSFIKNGTISLSMHCKIVLGRFLSLNFFQML